MLDYLYLDDAAGNLIQFHKTATRGLTSVVGLPGLGMVGARESIRGMPSAHGSINRSRYLKDRIVTLEGFVFGDTAGFAQSELNELTKALYDSIEAPSLLRWRFQPLESGSLGLELQAHARFSADDVRVTIEPPDMLRYQVNLRLSDPRGYTQVSESVRSSTLGSTGGGFTFLRTFPAPFNVGSTSGGDVSTFNNGTVDTPVIVRMYGMLVNPRIQVLPEGPALTLTGTIARGDYIEWNSGARYRQRDAVTLNGSASRISLINFTATRWFDLPRERTDLRLSADSFDSDAYAEIEYRHAYA